MPLTSRRRRVSLVFGGAETIGENWGVHGERGARAYIGGLGAVPPVGSRLQGQSPWSEGEAP